jgi:hypothetical protein
MARKPRTVKKVADFTESVVLPYALRRELEEITKNTGKEFDLSRPIEELEDICNSANRPGGAWRNRWTE